MSLGDFQPGSLSAALLRLKSLDESEQHDLRDCGVGDCLNFVEASRPSEAFLAALVDATQEDVGDGEAVMVDDVDVLAIEEPEDTLELKSQPIDWNVLGRQALIDFVASVLMFFLTSVIYVSGGQSVFGKFFDGELVFAAVDAMFAGTALTGILLPLFSSVPWAVAAVDVGFLPLLTHASEIIYHGVVVDAPDDDVGEDAELRQRAVFLATYSVAQCVIFLCVGMSLYGLGYFELTKLGNYLPYPVIAGLLASIGVSLVKSGLAVASKGGFAVSTVLGALWIAATFSLVGLSSALKQKLRVPGHIATPIVVTAGSCALFAASAACGVPRADLAHYGALFAWNDNGRKAWWAWTDRRKQPSHWLLSFARWELVARCHEVVIASCVIGALKIGIKCTSFASMFVAADVDPDREMRLVGMINCAAAFACSAGQAHSFSGIKVEQQLGASSKIAALIVPGWCLLAWLCGIGGIMRLIPRFVFGAMLVELGIDYVESYLIYPLRQRSRDGLSNFDSLDIASLVSIVITAIALNLLDAIALGLVLSLVGVSRRLAQRSIVAAVRSGKLVRSTIERTPAVMRALDELGDAIMVVDLVGYVFFGSAHELVDVLVARVKQANQRKLPPLKHLVLDLSATLPQFDVTAVASFEKIFALAKAKLFSIAIAPANSEAATALQRALGACSNADDLFDTIHGHFYESVDDALEIAEDDLLSDATGYKGLDRRNTMLSASNNEAVPLTQNEEEVFERKQRLFREWLAAATESSPNDEARSDQELVLAVAKIAFVSNDGAFLDSDHNVQAPAMALVVDGRLRLLNEHGLTVRKVATGNALAVGDFYLQDDDVRRSYSVVRTSHTVLLLMITYADLATLEKDRPRVAIKFHKLMARSLAQKNRNSKLAYRGMQL